MNEKMSSKLFYFFSLGMMCVILVMLTYMFFLRTIEVDLMSGLKVNYVGENGVASANVYNAKSDINQRTQDFLNAVTYTATPNENLSNGDMIHIVATYDEELAAQYHFSPKNIETDVEVEGLYNRYESVEEIDQEYLEKIYKEADKYVDKNAKNIYAQSGSEEKGKFLEANFVYKAFLKSNTSKSNDRVLIIYEIQYEVNEEVVSVYYAVSIPDINDSNEVGKKDIFGQKVYLTDSEQSTLDFKAYVNRVYSSQYVIQEIIEEEVVEEEIEETENQE